MLSTKNNGQRTIAGIAALTLPAAAPKLPEPRLIEALANALLENDDVDPATCMM
jgi:hypothetical protein